jgi:hypothetical protein
MNKSVISKYKEENKFNNFEINFYILYINLNNSNKFGHPLRKDIWRKTSLYL